MSIKNNSIHWGRGRLLWSLVCLYVLVSCSTAENYGLLSYFFDGVPNPADDVKEVEVDAFVGPPTPSQFAKDHPPEAPRHYIHAPYKEEKCQECHLSRIGGGSGLGSMMRGLPTMRKPMRTLCFTCHELAPRKWAHAPAVAGACNLCHDPHNSPYPALLLRADQKELCGQCHEGETFPSAERHEDFGERMCSDCHDPHAADAALFLRPGWEAGAMAEQAPSVLLKEDKKELP